MSELGVGMGSCHEWQRIQGKDGANIGASVDSSGGDEVRRHFSFLLNARPKNAMATNAKLVGAVFDFLGWRGRSPSWSFDRVRGVKPGARTERWSYRGDISKEAWPKTKDRIASLLK